MLHVLYFALAIRSFYNSDTDRGMNMKYVEKNKIMISETDGLELDMLELIPEGECKAVLQIHHGMSEYKERYLPFMQYMAERGYAVAIHDCRGHGKSVRNQNELGYMYEGGADALVEDTHQITMSLREKYPGVPLILFGHSMGSMVVRAYTKKYDRDIDMLIVCGSPSKNPYLGVGKAMVKILKKLKGGHYVSNLLGIMSFGAFARKFAGEKSRFAWCCSDPQVVKAYDESPLCGFIFTIDGYDALFQLMEETYSDKGWKCANPDMPVLFVGGAEDPCIGSPRKYAQAVGHMRKVGYWNTKGRLYPGMRHEILNEIGKEKVFHEIRRYIEKKLNLPG